MRVAAAGLFLVVSLSIVSACARTSADTAIAAKQSGAATWNSPLTVGVTYSIAPTMPFTFTPKELPSGYLTAQDAWKEGVGAAPMPKGEVPVFGIIHSLTGPHGPPSTWDGAVVWAFRSTDCMWSVGGNNPSAFVHIHGAPCMTWEFYDASTGTQVVSLGQRGWLHPVRH